MLITFSYILSLVITNVFSTSMNSSHISSVCLSIIPQTFSVIVSIRKLVSTIFSVNSSNSCLLYTSMCIRDSTYCYKYRSLYVSRVYTYRRISSSTSPSYFLGIGYVRLTNFLGSDTIIACS